MVTDPGDLVFDPTCVREGTRVWVVDTPPVVPPRAGGHFSLPAGGEGTPTPALPAGGEGTPTPALPAGGEGVSFPPVHGGIKGGHPQVELTPIETIQPGQYILAHDGKPHRVLRLIRRKYRGLMVGLRHALSPETLWLTADHRVLAKPRPRSLGGKRDWSAAPPDHLQRRRQLRREASPAERLLWAALRSGQLDFKFRRQHPICPYIADFYSREAHLVVELDGSSHFTPDAVDYDAQRDEYMRLLGQDVLRFTTAEVEQNLEGVCLAIKNQCRIRIESLKGARWVQTAALEPGDMVFSGPERRPVPVEAVERAFTEEEVFDLEVEGAHSFLTEVCAVHNCGSGTTAYVAEQWGRRWITCDTSRVALTLAKQRLMAALFDYYELAHPDEGVGSGFRYKTVPHITLKSIANNEPPTPETLYDQPFMDKSRARVSGPFIVEAVPAPVVKPLLEVVDVPPEVPLRTEKYPSSRPSPRAEKEPPPQPSPSTA